MILLTGMIHYISLPIRSRNENNYWPEFECRPLFTEMIVSIFCLESTKETKGRKMHFLEPGFNMNPWYLRKYKNKFKKSKVKIGSITIYQPQF